MKKTLTYLIATIAFAALSATAMAQGGLTPVTGSTHEYNVTAEDDESNTLEWSVVEGTTDTDYIIAGANTETVTITWEKAGTYTLQFRETADGTGCIALKEATVVVSANTFDVTISDSTIACNAADGAVNFNGEDTTTVISFTVDTVGVDWDFDWEVQFTLSTTATISDLTASAGDAITGSGTLADPYVITNIAGTVSGIDISMKVTGDAFTQQSVIMEVVSAAELKYNTPALLGKNVASTSTVNAIPNTSGISTD
ncbi:MAG TPA: hypothetical protein VEP89_08110 [Draconibacterium sp.]|nr:hypothetical protein [Draconibacterium sp.]